MLPNPFDLPGRDFLFFYVMFCGAVALGLVWIRRIAETRDGGGAYLVSDPYELAYLEGGTSHLLQVAVLSLIDRKRLEADDDSLRTSADAADGFGVLHRLDRAILQRFLTPDRASAVMEDEGIREIAEAVADPLHASGLLPTPQQSARRQVILVVSLALVMLVAFVKIGVGLQRGKPVTYLFLLSVLVPLLFLWLWNPLRTPAGEQALERAKALLQGLYERRKTVPFHGRTGEVVLLAAVFGLSALPLEASQVMKEISFRSADSGWSSSSSGCSGGGCGGGGCGGGGCGGCGGG